MEELIDLTTTERTKKEFWYAGDVSGSLRKVTGWDCFGTSSDKESGSGLWWFPELQMTLQEGVSVFTEAGDAVDMALDDAWKDLRRVQERINNLRDINKATIRRKK